MRCRPSTWRPRDRVETIFDVQNVNVFYGTHKAVADVNFKLPHKQITALIGPSGCGKSTFIRCLNRMNDLIPSARVEGSIVYHGQDLYAANIDAVQVRKRIGMVFQKPNPFPKSIYDNIAFGPRLLGVKGNMDEIVESALRRGALWDEVKDRLKTNAFGMSGGQQQRLCIARALATEPDVLLMDEPCSRAGPDLHGPHRGPHARAQGAYSIVIVTHNMQQAARVSDMTAFFTVQLSRERAADRPRRRVRRDRQDLHQPRRPPHRGIRHRQGRLTMATTGGRQHFQEELRDLEVQALGGHRPRHQDDGSDARGPGAPGHRARVDRHPRRRPHRRALSGGPAGDPVAAGPAGARRVGPAHGRGAAARDQARRADGRPVREHRQDAPRGRASIRPRTRRCSRRSSGWAGSPARRSSSASRRSCCATSPWPRISSARTREINRFNRCVFSRAVEIGTDADRREWAMSMMLVSRAIERIGDNAVDIGEQVAFVVTGRVPGVLGRLPRVLGPKQPRPAASAYRWSRRSRR